MPSNVSDQKRYVEFEQEPQEKFESIKNSSIDHASVLRYSDLLESISDLIAVLDRELRYQFVNRAFAEAVNLPKAKILNKSPMEIFPRIEESEWYKAAKTVLTDGKALFVSSEHVYKDGRKKWYRSRVYPVPTGILSISADITERILAEEEIHRQRNLLQSTLNSIANAVFILDDPNPNSRSPVIVDCNTAALRIFGYDKNEIIGKTPSFLYANNETFLEFQRHLYSAVEKGQLPFSLAEIQMKRKDGTVFTAERTVDRLLNEKEEHTGWVTIVRDITELKRLQDKVVQERDKARTYLDLVDVMILALDRNGNVTSLNRKGCEILGCLPEEVIGKNWIESFTRSRSRDQLKDALRLILNGDIEPVQHYENSVITRNGEERLIEWTSTLVRDDRGQIIGTISSGSDITERKRLEEELRKHTEHLEELVAERTAKLEESETRYRRLFESSPISLLEEDFSDIKKFLDDLRSSGIKNLRKYFIDHPDALAKCASMVKVVNVNETTLKLYGAKAVEQLKGELRRFFTHEVPDKFRDELVALGDGKTRFASEFDNQTLTGDIKHVSLILNVIPGYEDTLAKVLVSIIDLTERMNMQEELRLAKEHLEYAVFSNPAVITVSKPLPDMSDFISSFVSKSVSSMLGYEAEQLLGESGTKFWESHVPVEDLRKYRAEMPLLWKDGQHEFEYRFLHKDGRLRWIREEQRVVRDAEGNVRDVVGYWIDITERKKLEEALHEREAFLEGIVENIPDMIFLKDAKELRFVRFNKAAENLLGYRREDLIGKSDYDFFPTEQADHFVKKDRQTLENGKMVEIPEEPILTKEKRQRILHTKKIPILDASGKPQYLLGISEDITERKKLEEELSAAKEHLEYAVFSNPAVITVSKPLPDMSDFVGTFHSKSVSSMLGYEAEQLLGESGTKFWESHVPVEDLQKYRSEIPSLWKNGRHTFEYRFLHKDGKYRWIREEELVIRDVEGNPRDVVGYWIDITERKKLEDDLSAAKKQLEYVVAANPAVIYIGKPLPDLSDFTAKYMSENASSLFGFEARDFTERTNFSSTRIHPDDLIVFKQKLPGLWKNGHQTFEYRFLCKNEKYRWIREEAILVRDAAGQPQDVIGYTVDFSEQKKLEEALRTSEENLRKANENLELGLVETTEQIESIARLRDKLRQTPDLSTGLEMVLETIIWEFGMEIGAIFAFDREKGLANLQALKTQSENISLQQTYRLNTRFIEFDATPAKNIATHATEDDNSVLRTENVYSTAITIGNEIYGVLALGSNKTEKLTDTDLIILEFYTELISQTITERRLTVKPVREKPVRDETAPTNWPTPRDFKKPKLEQGCIYITKNDQSFAYRTFTEFVLAGSEGLCITREHPSKIRKRLGLEKTPIVWLTGEASPNEHTIGSLQDLSITLGDFLEKAEQPILLLDGFEYLITNNTFESFLKFLQIIRDRVQSHNAIVLAPIMEKAFEPRTLGLIERETTILEPKT